MRLIDVLRAGGWPDSELGNALGIVSIENPSANPAQPSMFNAQGTEDSWGLFQVNRRAHNYSVEQLINPVFNATVAYGLFVRAGNTYRDWVYAAQTLGLPPYGNARHSVDEYAALANKEVGGGGVPATANSLAAFAVLAVAAWLILAA